MIALLVLQISERRKIPKEFKDGKAGRAFYWVREWAPQCWGYVRLNQWSTEMELPWSGNVRWWVREQELHGSWLCWVKDEDWIELHCVLRDCRFGWSMQGFCLWRGVKIQKEKVFNQKKMWFQRERSQEKEEYKSCGINHLVWRVVSSWW